MDRRQRPALCTDGVSTHDKLVEHHGAGYVTQVAVDFQRVIGEADFRQEAAAIDVSVTIIHGDRDAYAPFNLTARRYAEIVPQADMVVYEGAARGLMITHAQRLAGDIAAASLR